MIENLPELNAQSLGIGAGTIALATLFASSWTQIKGLVTRFNALYISKAEINENLAMYVFGYLDHNYKQSGMDVPRYSYTTEYVIPLSRVIKIGVINPTKYGLYWLGWKPLFISYKEGKDNSGTVSEFTMSSIRGLIDYEQIVKDSIDRRNHLEHNKEKEKDDLNKYGDRYFIQNIFGSHNSEKVGSSETNEESAPTGARLRQDNKEDTKFLGWHHTDIGAPKPKSPMEGLYYSDEVLSLIEEIKLWYNDEQWFVERKVPWRMGISIDGPPGTGKSSFVKVIAQMFGIPIFKFDLPSMDNQELTKAWKMCTGRAPCIILFEDLDRVFNGRDLLINQDFNGKGKLTLDALLNCISGVENSDGVLTIVTSNNPQSLDQALRRGGRLDRQITIGNISYEGKRKMAARILNGDEENVEDNLDLINDLVNTYNSISAANFQNILVKEALKLYWEENQSESKV